MKKTTVLYRAFASRGCHAMSLPLRTRLRSVGGTLDDCDPPATLWHIERQEVMPVDAVPNAGELVASGIVEEIHFVFTVEFGGVSMPPLGLWVFEDGIGLNIRMGPEWTQRCAIAYLELLRSIWNRVPSPRLEFLEFNNESGFRSLWAEFLKSEPFSGVISHAP
ncbi:MAG: hypothetical protein R3B68_15300 [Phycisphaerales bacterium]